MNDTEVMFAQKEIERLKSQLLESQDENTILRSSAAETKEELKALKAKTQEEMASLHNESNVQKKAITDYEEAYTKSEALAKQYKTEIKKLKSDASKVDTFKTDALVIELEGKLADQKELHREAVTELEEKLVELGGKLAEAEKAGGESVVVVKEVPKEIVVEKIVERVVEKPIEVVVEKIVEVATGADPEVQEKLEAVSKDLMVKKMEVKAFRDKIKDIGEVMLKIAEADFRPGGAS